MSGALAGLHVLVVDDEADIRSGIARLVETTGAKVRTAASGEEALDVFKGAAIDLVLSDIQMKGMSGVELMREVMRRAPGTAVILITGYGTIAQAVECLQNGASHFLTKPFDNDELVTTVTRLGRKIQAERSVARDVIDASSGASRPPEGAPPASRIEIMTSDRRMKLVLDLVEQAAGTRLPVLVQGESGTGKELVARAVHARSGSAGKPFLAVNCAALPDTLLESELFGYRRGAFTGATRDHRGLFAQAQGGSVFLDEVPSMSLAFQGKLLRVLQERVVRPLGATSDEKVDFRLIGAANRNLKEMVTRGEFREDLYYRICVIEIPIPPLRERVVDIPLLAEFFLKRTAAECLEDPAATPELSPAALDELCAHSWPGNVRELENTIQRALITCRGPRILPHHLLLRGSISAFETAAGEEGGGGYEEAKMRAIERFQRQFITQALERTGGNISRAASECGLTRAAMQKIMKALSLEREDFRKG
jgi:DNA-binding NtrC family response regulator